jgi:hypothetical protein
MPTTSNDLLRPRIESDAHSLVTRMSTARKFLEKIPLVEGVTRLFRSCASHDLACVRWWKSEERSQENICAQAGRNADQCQSRAEKIQQRTESILFRDPANILLVYFFPQQMMIARNRISPQQVEDDCDEHVNAVIEQRRGSLIGKSDVGCEHGGWKGNDGDSEKQEQV